MASSRFQTASTATACPVDYVGKSVWLLCIYERVLKEFPKIACFRYLNLGLARSLHGGTLNGVASIQTYERWWRNSPAQGRGHTAITWIPFTCLLLPYTTPSPPPPSLPSLIPPRFSASVATCKSLSAPLPPILFYPLLLCPFFHLLLHSLILCTFNQYINQSKFT